MQIIYISYANVLTAPSNIYTMGCGLCKKKKNLGGNN